MARKRVEWMEEDRARHRAVREKFRDRPIIEQLRERGELSGETMGLGDYVELRLLLKALRETRKQLGLSLADLSERSGIDPAVLSRLENGRQENLTVATLGRYATALGKGIVFGLRDLPNEATEKG
jgi:DNA-binding Xre family transcriptional regulator